MIPGRLHERPLDSRPSLGRKTIVAWPVLFGLRSEKLLSWAGELGRYVDGADPTKVLDGCKESAGSTYSVVGS
jgi:hypothetical protein